MTEGVGEVDHYTGSGHPVIIEKMREMPLAVQPKPGDNRPTTRPTPIYKILFPEDQASGEPKE